MHLLAVLRQNRTGRNQRKHEECTYRPMQIFTLHKRVSSSGLARCPRKLTNGPKAEFLEIDRSESNRGGFAPELGTQSCAQYSLVNRQLTEQRHAVKCRFLLFTLPGVQSPHFRYEKSDRPGDLSWVSRRFKSRPRKNRRERGSIPGRK